METALMTWYGVVTLICAIVFAKMLTVIAKHRSHHNDHRKMIHIIQMSNEREMLYIPGDTLDRDGNYDDYNSDEQ